MPATIAQLEKEIEQLEKEKAAALAAESFLEAKRLRDEIKAITDEIKAKQMHIDEHAPNVISGSLIFADSVSTMAAEASAARNHRFQSEQISSHTNRFSMKDSFHIHGKNGLGGGLFIK